MMFLFAVPVMEGMGVYLVPLMVGTRNVAFPRLNAFGYWMYLAGGTFLYTAPRSPIRSRRGLVRLPALYPVRSSRRKGVDVWAQMITLRKSQRCASPWN